MTTCIHGSLARKCEICERDEEIASLRASLAEAQGKLCGARDLLQELRDADAIPWDDPEAVRSSLIDGVNGFLSSPAPCPHEAEKAGLREALKGCVDALGVYLDPKQNPTQYAQRYEASLLKAYDIGEAELRRRSDPKREG